MKWMVIFVSCMCWAQQGPDLPPEAAQLDWFIGEWDLTSKSLRRDGSYTSHKATSTVYRALDGYALLDEFRAYNDQNQVVFRGVSFRTYIPETGKWAIKWVMANEAGMTDLTAEYKNGELVMEGKGSDGMGAFLERAVYYNISADHYSFKLDRSYDGGKTWIKGMNLIEATRIN
ncbi:MAG: hypothetical protein KDC35_10855 [Acidobacteria bacterium]|nr:hypothetical protein [Acidobacteriota bacterium]